MKSLRDLSRIEVPQLYYPWFPREERENAGAMWQRFHGLIRFLTRFGYALALYDEASRLIDVAVHEKDRTRAEGQSKHETAQTFMLALEHPQVWQDIAVRDAAITIHDFHRTMANIQTLRRRCTTINALVDGAQCESAMREFSNCFPEARLVRHAAAHAADMAGLPERFRENAGSGNMSHGVRVGRTVRYTIERKLLTYEISQITLDKMQEITLMFFKAFEGVAVVGRQRMLENPARHGLD